MEQPPEHSNSFDRRRFIGNSIKLTLLASLISPFEQACNRRSKNQPKKRTKDNSNTTGKNTHRRKWNAEKLVLNTKSNVIHLPTSVFYIYYDEIKNTSDVNISNWESQLNGQVRLNKNKSGNILEILSLQKLRNGINDSSLSSAANSLAIAFSGSCDNSKGINVNMKNYRLHELMLQLIALNNSIPDKWQTFNNMVRKPQKIGRRQTWMADENNFNQRIQYIQSRSSDYHDRLAKRASKYNLT